MHPFSSEGLTETETAFNAAPIDRLGDDSRSPHRCAHVRRSSRALAVGFLGRIEVLFSSFQVTISRRRGLSMLIAVSS